MLSSHLFLVLFPSNYFWSKFAPALLLFPLPKNSIWVPLPLSEILESWELSAAYMNAIHTI